MELVYDPVIADEYRAEQTAKAGKGATVETVEKVPDVDTAEKKAPARKQAGVKAAARVAAAGKKTVAQTKKKATRAADGK